MLKVTYEIIGGSMATENLAAILTFLSLLGFLALGDCSRSLSTDVEEVGSSF